MCVGIWLDFVSFAWRNWISCGRSYWCVDILLLGWERILLDDWFVRRIVWVGAVGYLIG